MKYNTVLMEWDNDEDAGVRAIIDGKVFTDATLTQYCLKEILDALDVAFDITYLDQTEETKIVIKKMKLVETIFRRARLIRDMLLVSFDALIGLCLAFLFFFNPVHPAIFLLGALGALLPDFLTFLYLLLKHKPLGLFFDFHAGLIHSKVVLKLNQLVGVFLQFCTITVLIGILFTVKHLLI